MKTTTSRNTAAAKVAAFIRQLWRKMSFPEGNFCDTYGQRRLWSCRFTRKKDRGRSQSKLYPNR